jgi:hypothetical protein
MRSLAQAVGFKASASDALVPVRGDGGPMRARTDRVLGELRRARGELKAAGARLAPVVRALQRIESRLARPLRVAIVGEFNSGKSSLANLLVGIESLPTAVVSSTRIPTLLYQAPQPEIWAVHADGRRQRLRADGSLQEEEIIKLEVGLPSPRLAGVQVLDLPGLADPRFDRGLGDLFLQSMDVVLWCTAGTQAWKESERAQWQRLSTRLRERSLLVVTHADLLQQAGDREKLVARLRRDAGAFCDIVLVSTIEALALVEERPAGLVEARWDATGAPALENALDQLLDSVGRQRTQAALAATGRIARRALSRLE